jgi:hypothetical protein
MPRVHINLHDIDEIEDLEELEDWEEQIGLYDPNHRNEVQRYGAAQDRGRGRGAPRELRFGGSESRDRKRNERRKESARSARRYSQRA